MRNNNESILKLIIGVTSDKVAFVRDSRYHKLHFLIKKKLFLEIQDSYVIYLFHTDLDLITIRRNIIFFRQYTIELIS